MGDGATFAWSSAVFVGFISIKFVVGARWIGFAGSSKSYSGAGEGLTVCVSIAAFCFRARLAFSAAVQIAFSCCFKCLVETVFGKECEIGGDAV